MEKVQIESININELKYLIKEVLKTEIGIMLKPVSSAQNKSGVYGTRKEVAKELRISLPILNEHTKNGTLPAYKLGGRVLYKWIDIFENLELISKLKYSRDSKY